MTNAFDDLLPHSDRTRRVESFCHFQQEILGKILQSQGRSLTLCLEILQYKATLFYGLHPEFIFADRMER